MNTHATIACMTAAALLLVGIGPATADQRLVQAAKNQDTSAVRALVKQKGVNVNAAEGDGSTALLWAAQWDDAAMARVLIAAGAKVDAANEYGITPLSMAATNGSAVMVDLLLDAGANPNLAQPSGQTPLMTASMTGRLAPVKALLAKGARVDARDGYRGQNAVMWAIGERHADVTRTLIEAGADVRAASNTGFTPMMFAARHGDVPTMTLLLSKGAGVNDTAKDGTSVLHIAVMRGHVEAAEFLLDRGASVNAMAPGYSPLHWVAGTWDTFQTHDYPSATGEWANLGGLPTPQKVRLIKAMIAKGADVNAPMKTPPPKFGWSFLDGLRSGGSIVGATPFLLASMAADVDVMTLLVASGADPKAVTANNTTALMLAAGLATSEEETLIPSDLRPAAAALCLELGVPIDAQNSTGVTALHATAYGGVDPVATLLIARGANLNLKTKNGQTPLTIAEGYQAQGQLFMHPSTAAILKKAGATN